ncbi:MAG: hypothetical protein ABI851_04040 [Saprospiraceae bacterium]
MLDLLAFPDASRIWIYASDKRIPDNFIPDIHSVIQNFNNTWHSHQQELVSTGGILHNYFIVLVVDESKNIPGGCSIDKSVHFIQDLSKQYQVDFFDRMNCHYLENEEVKTIKLQDLDDAIKQNRITENTLFFDSLVSSKSQFLSEWLKPLSKSWLNKFVNL